MRYLLNRLPYAQRDAKTIGAVDPLIVGRHHWWRAGWMINSLGVGWRLSPNPSTRFQGAQDRTNWDSQISGKGSRNCLAPRALSATYNRHTR